MNDLILNRRQACKWMAAGLAGFAGAPELFAAEKSSRRAFRLNYIVASSMYGTLPLNVILPDVRKAGAEHIDIWPLRHGNQREQVEEMGHERFAALLKEHQVKLGIITRYDLGAFKLEPEMKVARKFGARMLICHSGGPAKLQGAEMKAAVRNFLEKMKPHLEAAAANNITIGIENHSNAIVASPDSIRYFAEQAKSEHIGIALAPYHLPQEPDLLARLIEDLGPKLAHFYAWQHGNGSMTQLPKEEEMLQMPGYGPLDFKPIVAALKRIQYAGWTSIFMHPFPRGIPILPTAGEVTAAINKSRQYLDRCVKEV